MPFGYRRTMGQCRGRPPVSSSAGRTLALSMLVFLPTISACSPSIATHGYRLDEATIAQIEPGRSSRQQVLQLLGSPSSVATFDDDAWYYVSQRTEKASFYQEDIVEQDVVTITFDDQDLVTGVDRFGLERTAAIDPVDRVTPTAGAEPSILKQLIGNIGRFNSGNSYDPDQ